MEKMKFLTTLLFFVAIRPLSAFPEPGLWENQKFEKNSMYFTKNVYNGTEIEVQINCDKPEKDFVVKWMLRYSPCAQEYTVFESADDKNVAAFYLTQITEKEPIVLFTTFTYPVVEYMYGETIVSCSSTQHKFFIEGNGTVYTKKTKTDEKVKDVKTADAKSADGKPDAAKPDASKTNATAQEGDDKKTEAPTTTTKAPAKSKPKQAGARRKRANAAAVDPPNTKGPPATTAPPKVIVTLPPNEKLGKVWKAGYYALILDIGDPAPDALSVTVKMKNQAVGYISATDWPLLVFYGVMGLVYIIYGLVWLVLLACNWRDLMRLQYWVGGVIFLGMLEKAVFYTDYQSVANSGTSVTEGTIIVAEVVSSLKRALARMLVIIVSVGFGIVKPRLGPTFHKVLFAGGLFFILATIEGSMRTLKAKGDQSSDLMVAAVPLAVVDAAICWWIFSSLVQTTRQLRLRRNIVKLTLYRHFTNTLILAVIAAIIFMIWSVIQIKMKDCIKNWHDLWIDEAFWHLLFSIILAIIMFLWRPSSNNQRYAFSPLMEADDEDEEDETPIHDAFDVKTRKKAANGSPRQKQNSIEEDLKWVEDNIPATLSDKASAYIESDEEVMTVKYEMSKMQ